MKYRLSCADTYRKILGEAMASRGHIESGEACTCLLIERGRTLPDRGIAIVFDPANLDELLAFLDGLNPATGRSVLLGRKGDGYEPIMPDNIVYFSAEGDNVYCQTRTGRMEVRKKLYELEQELARLGFIRANKSILLNIMMVSEIIPWFGGRLLLKFKGITDEVEVSRGYARAFKRFLGM